MISIDDLLSRLDHGTASELVAVYGSEEAPGHMNEIRQLVEHFRRCFPNERLITIVRAPGRVNLIGEHTDYNGFPVLPVALQFDVKIALAPRSDDRVELSNLDVRFSPCSFRASTPIAKSAQGSWENYVKAAVQGLLESRITEGKAMYGFCGVCSGNVPEAAGLSSSSALIISSISSTVALSWSHAS